MSYTLKSGLSLMLQSRQTLDSLDSLLGIAIIFLYPSAHQQLMRTYPFYNIP